MALEMSMYMRGARPFVGGSQSYENIVVILATRSLNFLLQSNFILNSHMQYIHVAGKFGGELNLAVWRSILQSPN